MKSTYSKVLICKTRLKWRSIVIWGCTMPGSLSQMGTAMGMDCAVWPTGFGVAESSTENYGEPFATPCGGVWVIQFDVSGISIWFVPVSDNSWGIIFTRLKRPRDPLCLQVESLPIPVNLEHHQSSSLCPAAIPPPSLRIARSTSTLSYAVTCL